MRHKSYSVTQRMLSARGACCASPPSPRQKNLQHLKPGGGPIRNTLRLELARSAFAYSAFASAFLFIMTVIAFGQTTLRVGHFPNVTHAQALMARGLEREGHNWFARYPGPNMNIER